jgi:hypothetical protein
MQNQKPFLSEIIVYHAQHNGSNFRHKAYSWLLSRIDNLKILTLKALISTSLELVA